MVALREKITAWLFVLNSCLRASNCSRRFSSPAGRLPGAGLLFGYSSFAAGSSAGGISALTPPTASHRAFAFCPPSMASAKTVSRAPCSGKGGCPGSTATGQAPTMDAQPWGRGSVLLRRTQKPGMGQHSLAGTSPFHGAHRVLHVACCPLRGEGSPSGMSPLHLARRVFHNAPHTLHGGGSPPGTSLLHIARCTLYDGGSPAGTSPLHVAPCTLHLTPCMAGAAQQGLHVAQWAPRSWRGEGHTG